MRILSSLPLLGALPIRIGLQAAQAKMECEISTARGGKIANSVISMGSNAVSGNFQRMDRTLRPGAGRRDTATTGSGKAAIGNRETAVWIDCALARAYAKGYPGSLFLRRDRDRSCANRTLTFDSYKDCIAAGASYTGAGCNGITNFIPSAFSIKGMA